MIFEILEWGGRGMRFVKSEEKICGLWLFRACGFCRACGFWASLWFFVELVVFGRACGSLFPSRDRGRTEQEFDD